MLKLGFKVSFGIQYQVFSVPWRNSVASCLERRDYSSSAPVRYIPQKSQKVKEGATSLPFNGSGKDENASSLSSSACGSQVTNNVKGVEGRVVLDLKKQNQPRRLKATKRELKEVDYEFGLREDQLMIDPEEVGEEMGVCKEEDCSQRGTRTSQVRKTTQNVENKAIELLAARAYTAGELRKKLIGKKFSPDVVEGLINDFQGRGLINDSLYAESFSRSRWSSSTWGPRRIKHALFKKGVSGADAEKAVKLVFEDGDYEHGDQESIHGLSKQAMDQLYVQASKQWLRGQDVPKETRKCRIIRWLQYRGFTWGVVSFILRKLESQESS